MDITTATPAQIDTEIARLQRIIARAESEQVAAEKTIERIDSVEGTYEADYPWNSPAKREEALATFRAVSKVIVEALAALRPLNAEYARRGGWSRFWLVTNTGGHVHRSTSCSTCFPTTQYAWLTEYSGMTDDEIVEAAKSSACTVCFADAPVESFNGKSRIRYESEEARERREERERKAAEKAAAEVVVKGYVGYGGRVTDKTFKTVRAVTNDIAGNLSRLCWYGEGHPSATEWKANIDASRKALADKGETYDYDKALAAARKKVTREGGHSKF